MGLSANSRIDTRQFSVFAVALLWATLLLSLASGAKGQAVTQPKVDEDPSGAPYVAGELLVAYEPGTSAQTEQAVVRRSGGQTAEELSGRIRLLAFPGIRRNTSEQARERALQRRLEDLRDEPGVAAADYNHIYRASFVPDDPRYAGQWGLRRAAFPGAWNDSRGAGVKIAIVDSGLDSNHPDIGGKISAQRDFVADDAVANDPHGHGTHVAGIAAALTDNSKGVAGGCLSCKLLVARVLNERGNTDAFTLMSGINWSANNGADVINLSLNGPDNGSLETAINNAAASGAVIVASAGNNGEPRYPAAYQKVIAVSATNKNDGHPSFSNQGNYVDLAAPGTNILSTWAGGGYAGASGTSESAPFVSALAGLLASEGKTATEIRRRMQSTATDLGASGDDPKFGHGRINANRAVP